MIMETVASPNFNARQYPVDMLVLHYTGMDSADAALTRMCDPDAMVSSHYMVGQSGNIVQLVDEEKRAWHAGISSWQGRDDLNSRSIGIEIVNGGHDFPLANGTLPPYSGQQIATLISLCRDIIRRRSIPHHQIVGHSDIAPMRKRDPGEHFPWEKLAAAGIGFWPQKSQTDRATMPGNDLGPGNKGVQVRAMQADLCAIGYAIDTHGTYDRITTDAVTAFQRRWAQGTVNGCANSRTQALIKTVRMAYDCL